MSQAKIEQAVETEYTEGGQYNGALYGVLAARQVFIQSILMDEYLMQKDVDDLRKLNKPSNTRSNFSILTIFPFLRDRFQHDHAV